MARTKRDKSWDAVVAAGSSGSSSAATAKPGDGGTLAAPCTAQSARPSPTSIRYYASAISATMQEGIAITLNEYLNRWLETAAKPKLREKS